MTINYKKTAWNDNASGYTPITPTRLNNIENALKSVCDGWDSVSQALGGHPQTERERHDQRPELVQADRA